jgi:PAS domain S-box-containing protein
VSTHERNPRNACSVNVPESSDTTTQPTGLFNESTDVEDRDIAPLVLQSSPEAIVAMDFEGKVLYWNPAAEALYGWRQGDVIGQNIFGLMNHDESLARTADVLKVMRTQNHLMHEIDLVRKEGSTIPGQVNLSQLRDHSDNPIGVVGVAFEVIERKRAEQRLTIQHALTRLLAAAPDFTSVVDEVLRTICGELDWDYSTLWIVDESEQILRCAASWHADDARYSAFNRTVNTFNPGRATGLIGRVWEAGELTWVVRLADDPNCLRQQEVIAAGLTSAVIVPICFRSGDVRGVIELLSSQEREPDDNLTSMLSAAAKQIGLFMERQQATESLVENEARLRTLEESNLIGIIRANLDGSISGANDAFLNMIGYSREEFEAGLRWDALTPDEWRHVDAEIIQDILTTGHSHQKEKDYLRKDGSRVAVLLGSAQLRPDTGDVVTFVVDISARKSAEMEKEASLRREQEARHQALEAQRKAEQLLEVTAALSRARTPEEVAEVAVKQGMAALGASDCSFRLLNDNGDALELIRSTRDVPGVLHLWTDDLLHLTNHVPSTECVVTGEPVWVESRNELAERFPTLRTIPFSFSASLASIPLIIHGSPVGTISFGYREEHAFTASERVFIETLVHFCSQALERARLFVASEAAVRAREEFLSIASHEMRTPLTTISGFAHLLNRQLGKGLVDHERIAMITDNLLTETQRLDLLVGALLDLSRIQQGRFELFPGWCDLSSVLEDVASQISRSREFGGKRDIVIDAPDTLPGVWDRLRIEQVITILLTNALKYSTEDQILLSAHIDDDETAVLNVQDHGIGIPRGQESGVFDPFVRATNAKRIAGGTGLGLYIARKIVETHDGTIGVESKPGQGSTFTVRLPLQPTYESV